MQEKIEFCILYPPFPNSLIEDLVKLHKDKGESFSNFIKFLLSFPLGSKENIHSDFLYVIVGYFNKQIISSAFLFIPNKYFPQEMRFSFIANVLVMPEFQHKGIATKSINICESICYKHYCSGIFLATSNENLKDNFYAKLDFYRHKSDDWLLKKDLRCKPIEKRQCQYTHNITPFDLATIQSLCAFPHYKIIDDAIEAVECSEIEEDFLNWIMEFPNQFLYIEHTKKLAPIIAWIILGNNICRQIILNQDISDDINYLIEKFKKCVL